jgi:outer membrane lipoprotein carrier protein
VAPKILICLLALTLTAALVGGARAESPAEVMDRVQRVYDQAGAFKAYFRQESRLKAAPQAESAEGWMYFQKPCRMRWQYEAPPEQKKEIVADGSQVWLYMPQDKLVMVYRLDKVLRSDLVMRFFSGMGQFQKDFEVAFRRPPEKGSPYVIDLVPKKPQAELKRLTLTIDPRSYQVEKLEFENALGEESRFSFSRLDLNPRLKAGFFTFTPPPGAQVVKESPGGA